MTANQPGPARTLLGGAAAATLLVGLLSTAVAAVAVGRDGALGAVVGIGLVLGFLLVGQLPVAQVAAGRRAVGVGLLLFLYSSRVLLLLLALRTFSVDGRVDRESLGLTVIACALAWTAGTVRTALRWRPMVVEPDKVVRP